MFKKLYKLLSNKVLATIGLFTVVTFGLTNSVVNSTTSIFSSQQTNGDDESIGNTPITVRFEGGNGQYDNQFSQLTDYSRDNSIDGYIEVKFEYNQDLRINEGTIVNWGTHTSGIFGWQLELEGHKILQEVRFKANGKWYTGSVTKIDTTKSELNDSPFPLEDDRLLHEPLDLPFYEIKLKHSYARSFYGLFDKDVTDVTIGFRREGKAVDHILIDGPLVEFQPRGSAARTQFSFKQNFVNSAESDKNLLIIQGGVDLLQGVHASPWYFVTNMREFTLENTNPHFDNAIVPAIYNKLPESTDPTQRNIHKYLFGPGSSVKKIHTIQGGVDYGLSYYGDLKGFDLSNFEYTNMFDRNFSLDRISLSRLTSIPVDEFKFPASKLSHKIRFFDTADHLRSSTFTVASGAFVPSDLSSGTYDITALTPNTQTLEGNEALYAAFKSKFTNAVGSFTKVIADYDSITVDPEFLRTISNNSYAYYYKEYVSPKPIYEYLKYGGIEPMKSADFVENPRVDGGDEKIFISWNLKFHINTVGIKWNKSVQLKWKSKWVSDEQDNPKEFSQTFSFTFQLPQLSISSDIHSYIRNVVDSAEQARQTELANILEHTQIDGRPATDRDGVRFKLFQHNGQTFSDITDTLPEGIAFNRETGVINITPNGRDYQLDNLYYYAYLDGFEDDQHQMINDGFKIDIKKVTDIRLSNAGMQKLQEALDNANKPFYVIKHGFLVENLIDYVEEKRASEESYHLLSTEEKRNIQFHWEISRTKDYLINRNWDTWRSVDESYLTPFKSEQTASFNPATGSISINSIDNNQDWTRRQDYFSGKWKISISDTRYHTESVIVPISDKVIDLLFYNTISDIKSTSTKWLPRSISQDTYKQGFNLTQNPDLEVTLRFFYVSSAIFSTPVRFGTDEFNDIFSFELKTDSIFPLSDQQISEYKIQFNHQTGAFGLASHTEYNIPRLKLGILLKKIGNHERQLGTLWQARSTSVSVTKYTTIDLTQQYNLNDQSGIYRNGYDSGSMLNYIVYNNDPSLQKIENPTFELMSADKVIASSSVNLTIDGAHFNYNNGQFTIDPHKQVVINNLWLRVIDPYFNIKSSKPENLINLNVTSHTNFILDQQYQPQNVPQSAYANGFDTNNLIDHLTFEDNSSLSTLDKQDTNFSLWYKVSEYSNWTNITNTASNYNLSFNTKTGVVTVKDHRSYNLRHLKINITNTLYTNISYETNEFGIVIVDGREYNIASGLPKTSDFVQTQFNTGYKTADLSQNIQKNGVPVPFDQNTQQFVLYRDQQEFVPDSRIYGISFSAFTGQITVFSRRSINLTNLSIALRTQNAGETPRSSPFNINVYSFTGLTYNTNGIIDVNQDYRDSGYQTPSLLSTVKYQTQRGTEVETRDVIGGRLTFKLYQNDVELTQQQIESYRLNFDSSTGVVSVKSRTPYDIDNLQIVAVDSVYNVNSKNVVTKKFSVHIISYSNLLIKSSIPAYLNIFNWYQQPFSTPNLSESLYYVWNSTETKLDPSYVQQNITFKILQDKDDITDKIANTKGVEFNRQTGVLTISKDNELNEAYNYLRIAAYDSRFNFHAYSNYMNIDALIYKGDMSLHATMENYGQSVLSSKYKIYTNDLRTKLYYGDYLIRDQQHLDQYVHFELLKDNQPVSDQFIKDNHLEFSHQSGQLIISPHTEYNLYNLSIKAIDTFFNSSAITNQFYIRVVKFNTMKFDGIDGYYEALSRVGRKPLSHDFNTINLRNQIVYDNDQRWNWNYDQLRFYLVQNDHLLSEEQIKAYNLELDSTKGILTIKAHSPYKVLGLKIKAVNSYFNLETTTDIFNVRVIDNNPIPTPKHDSTSTIVGVTLGISSLAAWSFGVWKWISYIRSTDRNRTKVK